jgi:hypothetical protein
MPNTSHYPSNFYDAPLGSNYNNVVTRRLAVRDWVGFAPSQRFGGQQYEQKGVTLPYRGTIMETVAACQQLVSELNLISPLIPDMGAPVLLSQVGVATNVLTGPVLPGGGGLGVASYIGAAIGTAGLNVSVDGVGFTTGLRVLYYGLSTAALNGVYTVSFGTTFTSQSTPVFYLSRSSDLTNWWQFVQPKVYLASSGTNNKGNLYALATDTWVIGNTFNLALGQNVGQLQGTSILFASVNYSPGIGTTTSSLIAPPFNVLSNTGGFGEYDFLANDSLAEFMYIKNRAHRLAYRIFKMRENYQPFTSSYGNNIIVGIATANYRNNIGFSTFNDLPAQSRYPSGYNRGW